MGLRLGRFFHKRIDDTTSGIKRPERMAEEALWVIPPLDLNQTVPVLTKARCDALERFFTTEEAGERCTCRYWCQSLINPLFCGRLAAWVVDMDVPLVKRCHVECCFALAVGDASVIVIDERAGTKLEEPRWDS
jgi:hypothetical protein